MTRNQRFFTWAAALLVCAALAASCSRTRKPGQDTGHACAFCNMKVRLPQDKLGARIVFKDGREEYYCEMAHALMGWRIATQEKPDPANPPVAFHAVDYMNEGVIDARAASYVVGSSVESAMFTKSVAAFENHEAALRFAEERGGQVCLFDEDAVRKFADLRSDDPKPACAITTLGDLNKSKWKKHKPEAREEHEH